MYSIRTAIDFYGKYGKAKFITFNGIDDNREHFALIFKSAHRLFSPLVRVHSECITGEVFGSEHCDCGDQLNESLNIFRRVGGILIYLRQEGRGAGLYNKIDAYKFQAEGIDTFLANEKLSLPHDLRQFGVAGNILKALNVKKIKLLTNNLNKAREIEQTGIQVLSIENTHTYEKPRNRSYLFAKYLKAGHQLKLR
jgi:GTP cyclohydrolase II